MYFQNSELRETLLDKCLKSRASEEPWKDNITNGLKDYCNLNDSPFTRFINQLKAIALEKVFFDDIQNCKTFC